MKSQVEEEGAVEEGPLVFQDVLKKYLSSPGSSNDSTAVEKQACSSDSIVDDDAVSLAFFELANAPEFAYRINPPKRSKKRQRHSDTSSNLLLRLNQDISACGEHTGGIVWETSALLLQYLLYQFQQERIEQFKSLGSVVELGAGCGLLGQGLVASLHSKQCQTMVQTETRSVLKNLQSNLQQNRTVLGGESNDLVSSDKDSFPGRIRACVLDWTRYKPDSLEADIQPNSFDTALGTDVIFNPSLVKPLLETLDFLVKKKEGVVYICVQERCAASHSQFLRDAPSYGFCIQELTKEIQDIPSCKWGLAVECHLYRLARSSVDSKSAKREPITDS